MHPQAGCSTGPQSFKSFLRLLRANCLALCSDQCPGGGCRLAGIILNCYQLVTRHPTPAAQPAKCPPEAKQVSRKANYVKCKTNSGRKNNGGAGWDAVIWPESNPAGYWDGFYVALHFSYSCRIVPCPLEVTIKRHFALVLVWIPSEKADTQKLECFLSQSKITLGGFLKNENLYKLFTSRLG